MAKMIIVRAKESEQSEDYIILSSDSSSINDEMVKNSDISNTFNIWEIEIDAKVADRMVTDSIYFKDNIDDYIESVVS